MREGVRRANIHPANDVLWNDACVSGSVRWNINLEFVNGPNLVDSKAIRKQCRPELLESGGFTLYTHAHNTGRTGRAVKFKMPADSPCFSMFNCYDSVIIVWIECGNGGAFVKPLPSHHPLLFTYFARSVFLSFSPFFSLVLSRSLSSCRLLSALCEHHWKAEHIGPL